MPATWLWCRPAPEHPLLPLLRHRPRCSILIEGDGKKKVRGPRSALHTRGVGDVDDGAVDNKTANNNVNASTQTTAPETGRKKRKEKKKARPTYVIIDPAKQEIVGTATAHPSEPSRVGQQRSMGRRRDKKLRSIGFLILISR